MITFKAIIDASGNVMVGVKKKSISPVERKQRSRGKEKKKKGAMERERAMNIAEGKARADALVVEDVQYVLERLRPLKALTTYSVMHALNVKASTSNALLTKLVEMGLAEKVGGYSGHHVYALKGD